MTSTRFCPMCGLSCNSHDRECDAGHKQISQKEMEEERQKLCDQTENDDE